MKLRCRCSNWSLLLNKCYIEQKLDVWQLILTNNIKYVISNNFSYLFYFGKVIICWWNILTFQYFLIILKMWDFCYLQGGPDYYTKGNMFWHPATFSMRNLTVFAKLCPHHKYKDTKLIHHFKALIFSSLELQGQRARPPNKASTPSWMKLELFSVKGAWRLCLEA